MENNTVLEATQTTPRALRYKQAAIAYFVYGVIYLIGAVYLAEIGLTERGSGSGWVWFAMGLIFLIVFPGLIYQGMRWFTLVVAGFMVLRVAGLVGVMISSWNEPVPLPLGGVIPEGAGALVFAAVTLAAMGMLLRASLPKDG